MLKQQAWVKGFSPDCCADDDAGTRGDGAVLMVTRHILEVEPIGFGQN